MGSRWWAVLVTALVVAGCTPGQDGPVGQNLGSLRYVVDLAPAPEATTDVLLGDDIDRFAEAVATDYRAPELADAVRRVDSGSLVVTLYFDACTKDGPQLHLNGDQVRVEYAVSHGERACARAIDTLVVFSVPISELPDPVHFALCGPEPITVAGGEKSGRIQYRLC